VGLLGEIVSVGPGANPHAGYVTMNPVPGVSALVLILQRRKVPIEDLKKIGQNIETMEALVNSTADK